MISVFRYEYQIQDILATYNQNLKDCDDIISGEDTMMKPLLLKADALHKLGKLDECKAVYEIVLLVDPGNEKARKSVETIERLQQR